MSADDKIITENSRVSLSLKTFIVIAIIVITFAVTQSGVYNSLRGNQVDLKRELDTKLSKEEFNSQNARDSMNSAFFRETIVKDLKSIKRKLQIED